MTTVSRSLLLVGFCVACAAWSAGAAEGLGDLFHIGVSARALGMGGALTAIADDEGAVLYNPARLSEYRRIGISSLYAAGFGGVSQGAVVAAVPYAALGIVFLDSGLIGDGEEGFRYASQGAILGVGIPLGFASLGARWRFLRVSSPFEGSGWSLDPALAVDVEYLHVGLVWEAAASMPMAYEGGSEEAWEQGLRAGLAVTLSPAEGVTWTAAMDAVGLFEAAPRVAAGIEAWIAGVGARVGYDGTGLTCGLSARFPGLEVDWAYAARGDLGDSHRVTLALRF